MSAAPVIKADTDLFSIFFQRLSDAPERLLILDYDGTMLRFHWTAIVHFRIPRFPSCWIAS